VTWLKAHRPQVQGDPAHREFLGQLVRMEWVKWAREQPNPKPSWLTPWHELTEPEREVDRRIGERIYRMAIGALYASPQVQGGEAVAWRWWDGRGWLYAERPPPGAAKYEPLYTTPQRAPGVSVDDVRELVDWIFTRFGAPVDAGELPQHIVQAVRRLEAAIASGPSGVDYPRNAGGRCEFCNGAREYQTALGAIKPCHRCAAQDQGEGNG
jgi:hypothetical protein